MICEAKQRQIHKVSCGARGININECDYTCTWQTCVTNTENLLVGIESGYNQVKAHKPTKD